MQDGSNRGNKTDLLLNSFDIATIKSQTCQLILDYFSITRFSWQTDGFRSDKLEFSQVANEKWYFGRII